MSYSIKPSEDGKYIILKLEFRQNWGGLALEQNRPLVETCICEYTRDYQTGH